MFDAYIVNFSGDVLELDHFLPLMDDELTHIIFDLVYNNGNIEQFDKAQKFWNCYCSAHFEKNGEPFYYDYFQDAEEERQKGVAEFVARFGKIERYEDLLDGRLAGR